MLAVAVAQIGRNQARQTAKQEVQIETPLPKIGGEQLFTPDEWLGIGKTLGLSNRELSIAVLLLEGYTREAIACLLHKADGQCLSPDTVRVYVDRVYEKTQVRDRLALARRIFRTYLTLDQKR